MDKIVVDVVNVSNPLRHHKINTHIITFTVFGIDLSFAKSRVVRQRSYFSSTQHQFCIARSALSVRVAAGLSVQGVTGGGITSHKFAKAAFFLLFR